MDNYVDTLKSIFVEAAKLAKVIPNNLFKLKKYTCPDLTQARDTKNFGGVCELIIVDHRKEKYINVIQMWRKYSVNYQDSVPLQKPKEQRKVEYMLALTQVNFRDILQHNVG